jgi:hypothetical protein
MQIRCVAQNHPACSGVPETVIITDMNYYPVARYHFDLSGTAFGAMALPGRNDQLRHAGIIDMQFKRYHNAYLYCRRHRHYTSTVHTAKLALATSMASLEATRIHRASLAYSATPRLLLHARTRKQKLDGEV